MMNAQLIDVLRLLLTGALLLAGLLTIGWLIGGLLRHHRHRLEKEERSRRSIEHPHWPDEGHDQ